MLSRFVAASWFGLLLTAATVADDHRVEVLKEPAPADELSEDVRGQLADAGLRVIRGSSRTVCDIWPCKQWKVQAGFEPTFQRLYPFQPGQLVGVLRFRRRGSDFRDQPIRSGVYTLRYALQPVDGNHVGTSPTQDFLLMVSAEADKSTEPWDMEKLTEASMEAAGSSHPAMLCLQKSPEGAGSGPAMRHDQQNDWWILHFVGKAIADGKTHELPVDLVVEGHASE